MLCWLNEFLFTSVTCELALNPIFSIQIVKRSKEKREKRGKRRKKKNNRNPRTYIVAQNLVLVAKQVEQSRGEAMASQG